MRKPTKRKPQERSNEAFRRMVVRMMHAYARRVAITGTEEDIAALVNLADDADQAVAAGILELRRQRFTWGTIAEAIGTSRQNAEKRWGRRDRSRRAA
jgi:hypothetical protein